MHGVTTRRAAQSRSVHVHAGRQAACSQACPPYARRRRRLLCKVRRPRSCRLTWQSTAAQAGSSLSPCHLPHHACSCGAPQPAACNAAGEDGDKKKRKKKKPKAAGPGGIRIVDEDNTGFRTGGSSTAAAAAPAFAPECGDEDEADDGAHACLPVFLANHHRLPACMAPGRILQGSELHAGLPSAQMRR